MFKKRVKKEFPPGTFIPTPARILTIVQLSLAFALLLWQASQPFMGDLFRTKSQMLSYQNLMGIAPHHEIQSGEKARLERNIKRFEYLPQAVKQNISEQYLHLLDSLQYTFGQKMQRLFHLFAYEMNPYELGWIFFSITLSILLLKRIEGTLHAVWLLPALALFFLFDNQMHGTNSRHQLENQLFPSEQLIIRDYLKEPLSTDILKQREQLLYGWRVYLIKEWAHENPSDDLVTFQLQAEHGEYLFNVMRLSQNTKSTSIPKISLFVLFIYFLWNLFFAWFVNRQLSAEKHLAHS